MAKLRKQWELIGLWLIVGILLLSACDTAGTWQRIQETNVLRVGLDPTFPPFEMADGVPLEGLDVDLAQAIGDDLGLQIAFSYFGYDGLYDALFTDQVDVLISALVIQPEQMKDFAYSDYYFDAGEILLVHEDVMDIEEMADLNGRNLSVELGAQGHVAATQWARRLPDLTVQPYETPDGAITAVVDGLADAVLIDSVSGRLFLKQNPDAPLRRIEEPVTVEPYAFVVRAQDKQLLAQLNDSLVRLGQSGQLEQIISQWLGN